MAKIVSLGEILVEIMADTVGNGFLEPIALTGPFPSGAPTIFISQAARMGADTAYVSAVGNDDFGRINLNAKTFQFQLARAMARRKALDATTIEDMGRDWQQGMDILRARYLPKLA